MNLKLFLSVFLTSCLLCSSSLYAQSRIVKKLERKAKLKLEQRAERKADRAMDKGLDKIEAKIDKSVKKKNTKKKDSSVSESAPASAGTSSTPQKEAQTPSEMEELNREKESEKVSAQKTPKGPQPFEQTVFGHEKINNSGIIGKGPYGIASGMFIQITKTQHDMMESVSRDTVYFDKFGQLQARFQQSEQKIKMMGIKRNEKSRLIAIHKNDSIYSHDPEKRTGHVMINPAREFYQGMTEADMKNFAGEVEQDMNTTKKKLGTDRVAGKLCEVLEFTSHTENGEVMMITRMWWWRGINMKSHSRGMGAEIQQEITLIKNDIRIDKNKFQPNPKIKFQSFSFGNY